MMNLSLPDDQIISFMSIICPYLSIQVIWLQIIITTVQQMRIYMWNGYTHEETGQ